MSTRPPEELDTPVLQKQCGVAFQLFTSLLLVRRGWFANNALERTAAPLLRSTIAVIQTRIVRSTVPVGSGRSAFVR